MFTQIQSVHVGRCNGCNRNCKLGSQAVILYDNYLNFRPTINGKPIFKYIDKNGKKRFLTMYHNPKIALSYARTASRLCKHYQRPEPPKPSTLQDTQCHGCENKCILGSQRILTDLRDGHLPVIGTKTIKTYTDKRGRVQIVPHYNTSAEAARRAAKIAKLCDHYQR